MPIVIDLLSSPDLPIQVKATTTVNDPAPKKKLPSKALSYKAPKTSNDDWFALSSSGSEAEDILPPPMPVSKPSSITAPKASSSTITFTKHMSSLNTTSKPSQSTYAAKSSNEFVYLSDDFDSTVNLDDPFASDPPPAKKRRLSPSPDASVIVRSPEYQRWVDKLEKSTAAVSNTESSNHDARTASKYSRSASDMGASANKPTAPTTMAGAGISKTATTSASTYKRSTSDIGASGKYTLSKKTAGGLKRSKTMGSPVEADPIVFTSSPDRTTIGRKRKEKSKDSNIRDRVNDLLADFSSDDGLGQFAQKNKKGKEKSNESYGGTLREFEFDSSDIDLPDIGAISRSHAVNTGKDKFAAMTALDKYEAEKAKEKKAKEKEQKSKEKDENAKSKVAAKEVEKEQKRLAKEEKVREKDRAAELARVNMHRTDKKKSTQEMIVDFPSCLGFRTMEQMQTFLEPVGAEHSVYESLQPIIRWRRKIDSEYDEEAGHWDTVKKYIRDEKHIMCIITAKEFVELATGEEGKDLETHVVRMKAKFSTNDIIYLVEGLEPWMRKNKNLQNRKYVQEVRNQGLEDPAAPTASQKRKKKPETEYVDQVLIEDALLQLQIMHGVLIHHTKVAIETAEWVSVFTQHISTVPYKAQQQSLDTAFCMESGQVKCGDGPTDTFVKMLQEMVRVTASIAYGIAAEYPTVQKLVEGFRENGPLAIQDCRKTANKDGAFTDKRVGPSISKRMHNVFTCRDPGSWDV